MSYTEGYTHIEKLLLFQALETSGTDANTFSQISEKLKASSFIPAQNQSHGRLSPDALRELYLKLLHDELRNEIVRQEGNVSPSKRRKLASPPPLSIKSAQQYNGILPRIADDLYDRYRQQMVWEIKEDEKKFADLDREIAEIERGEWDEKIARDTNTSKVNGSDKASSAQGLPQESASSVAKARTTQALSHPQPEGLAINDVLNTPGEQSRAATPVNSNLPPNGKGGRDRQVPSSTSSVDPSRGRQPVQKDYEWNNSFQGGTPLPPQQQYPTPSNYPQYQSNPPYPYQHPPRGPFPVQYGLPPPQNMISSSPQNGHMVLPPPNMSRTASGSSPAPLEPAADMAGQQAYRQHTAHPTTLQQPIQGQGYAQYPQYNNRTQSVNGPHPQWPQQQQYPPPQGAAGTYYMPPGHRSGPPLDAQQPPHSAYSSPYHPNQKSRPSLPASAASTPRARPRESMPHTPLSQTLRDHTGIATRWTPKASASTPRTGVELPRPAVEPISPIAAAAKLATKSAKDNKNESMPAPRAATSRARAGSTASSAVARSARSQSVLSHTDELSLDNDNHPRRYKRESDTPRAEFDGDTTADESTNRRRGRRPMSSPPRRTVKRKREASGARETVGPPTHVMWTRNFPKISAQALEHMGAHRNANLFATPLKEKDAPGYKDLILRPQDLKTIKSAVIAGARAGNAVLASMEDNGASIVSLPISEDLVPPKGIVNNTQLEKEVMRMFANAIMYNPDIHRGLPESFLLDARLEDAKEAGMEGYAVDENKVVKDTRIMEADVGKILEEMRGVERGMLGDGEDSAAGDGADDEDIDELAGDGESGPARRKRRL